MKRRTYLTTATATTALAVAGCTSGGDDDPDNDSDDEFGEFDDDEPSEAPPDLAGTWDDFESLEEWTATKGSMAADTDRSVTGSQSVRLSPDSDARGRIVKSLSSPLDCSEVVPGLAMASESSNAPAIQLWDENGHKAQYRQQTDPENPFVRRNFGLSKMGGEVDLTRIGEIHIVHWLGDDHEGDLWIDDLFFAPRSENGQVMVQFHGGYESEYETAYPILDEHDIPATTFVATGRVRTSENAEGNRLTTEHLDELSNAGWTVGSYANRGLRMLDFDPEDREAEVRDAAAWLEDNGYGDGARFFAFPGGQFDEVTYDAVADQHDLAFAGRFPAQGYAANPHLCTRVANPDPETAGNLVEWTAEVGGITSIAFTHVDDSVASTVEALASSIAEQQEAGDLSLISPAQLADEYVF
ncbi:putative xylanase/chitin deacetylase [Halovivax ruber XH-70]|uniref:Putative xylanase/chitin deacetylase n=1 Tax=Halovivax ruber (strain DSM 18193 / JCM 13892 / XH-70) TaxID=797302 RepID=L0IBY4_HALRX|nr:polysaccharide deacetylase family protein [Halovivax ruber]AGB17085.1 putative xylanase/chitin deacetylase [Halovivax ruber XH-70]